MARYHDLESSFWEDFQDYSKNEKLLYIYAFTNPLTRDSGIYQISVKTILLNTGLTQKEFDQALVALDGKIYYDKENKVMFVCGKLKRRMSGLKNNTNMLKAIQHDLSAFSSSYVTSLFTNKYEGALKGLASLSLPRPLPLPLPLTKEIDNINTKKQKEKLPKKEYAEFVTLQEKEYDSLISKHGKFYTEKAISALNNYKGSHNKKYDSDYYAIRSWVMDKVKKECQTEKNEYSDVK